ncbi:hypothetical protein [Streptacidiphilus sp. EB129]|jgi:hypothetical protein|uniref:hypothetical protein n=1 Tax=Streptacidiphilus sp. EB129 TaxID=3156262 RepID=UPI0035152739
MAEFKKRYALAEFPQINLRERARRNPRVTEYKRGSVRAPAREFGVATEQVVLEVHPIRPCE